MASTCLAVPAPAGAAFINNGTFNQNSGTLSPGLSPFLNNPTGLLRLFDSASAGIVVITNLGRVEFHDTSTGGNATITNSASVRFLDTSTAGNITIITNSGGRTFFENNSNGGNAQLTANTGGIVDFSGTSGPTGNNQITAGSIAGAGTFLLGQNQLTVGSNNLSTTVSGTIQDGGAFGGTGGSLVKIGTGILTLAGASTYTGATIVNVGTLQAGASNAFSSFSAFTVASGATLDLNSFNQTIGSLAGAGSATLGSATLTTGNDNTSTTFSGVISGSGSLTKIGTGTLTLSNVSTYSGATTVNAGTLLVNGSIANSAVTVNNGGLLAGTGTVGPTTIKSGGTFAPGNSPGTITVAGNLAFQPGALYQVQVTSATASMANVSGSATLTGASVQAVFAPGSFLQRSHIILHSGGLGGTTFSGVSANVPPNFTASLSYTTTDVNLNLIARLGETPAEQAAEAAEGTETAETEAEELAELEAAGLKRNQINVALALNNFYNSGGTLTPAFGAIFELTGSNLANALSQLSGEAATGAQQVAFQLTDQFLNLMLDPFVDGRSGVGGAAGPALGFAPEREALPEDVALAYAKAMKGPVYKGEPLSFERRWGVWAGGYGGYNKTGGDPVVDGSHDLSARVAGGAAGLDYHVTRDTVVGFALAGGGTNWSLADGLGSGKSDAFQAGVYGATRSGPAYLAAAFAFANHWMSTDRFAPFGDHLIADFNAQSYGGRAEAGYRFGMAAVGITPYAAIQAQSFHTPSYSETDTNGGGFPLAFNSRTATDTRSELGARFDRVLALYTNAVLSLRARLAWAHDRVSDPTLAAVFQTLPGASFIVNGATPAKDSALASAGAEYRLANGVILLAKFDGDFASHSSTYAGTGTIRYAW